MDVYANWRRRLKGEDLPIHADHPECGRYKVRRTKGGKFEPFAIFMSKEGELMAAIGKEFVDPHRYWLHAVKTPVTEAEYKHAMAHGHFPDEPAPRTVGDNRPPETIEELIPLEIEEASNWLSGIGEIKTQQDADIASNRVAALRELKKQAEAEHKREKEPHLAAGRKVDAKYKPLIESVDNVCRTLLAAVTKFLNAEAARKRAEAEAETARQRAKQEEERRQAAARGQPEPEDVPLPLEPPAPIKVQAGGARGRKIGLRTVTVVTVSDYAAALAHFKDHPEVKSCVQKLCEQAVKSGSTPPGVTVTQEQRAA